MSQQSTGPVAIIGGRAYPITAAQYAHNRAGKPMGHILGAPAPVAAVAPDSTEVARKAAAFDRLTAGTTPAMESTTMAAGPDEPACVVSLVAAVQAMPAEKVRMMSHNSALRLQGVDPKATAAPGAAPKPTALTGRALSRASMEKLIHSQRQELVRR